MKINIEDLTMKFGTETVLDSISLKDDIDTLSLIGSSGTGKSTLLRILGGLETPTTGRIILDDLELPSDEKNKQAYRKKLGFVFQQGGLFYHRTARENIVNPLVHVHNWSREEADERASVLLERFGLKSIESKRPSALSGGQRQRVAICRAVAARPTVLLLDEPTSALDPEYTNEVLDVLKELGENGMRMILVTHEMGFAKNACEKVLFLSKGRICEYGPSEQLFEQPDSPELRQFLDKLLQWNL